MVLQTRAAEPFFADDWRWASANREESVAAILMVLAAIGHRAYLTLNLHKEVSTPIVQAPLLILKFEAWFAVFILFRSAVRSAPPGDLRDAPGDGAVV